MHHKIIGGVDINDPKAIIQYISDATAAEAKIFLEKYCRTKKYNDLQCKSVAAITDNEIICYTLTRTSSFFNDSHCERFLKTKHTWKNFDKHTQKHLHLISLLLFPKLKLESLIDLQFPRFLSKGDRAHVKEEKSKFITAFNKYPNDKFINLSAMDLAGIHLQNNLQHVYFRSAHLKKSKLKKTDLSMVDLCNADLTNADLHKAKLRKSILCEANLNSANLKEAQLKKSNLYGTEADNANLEQANLKKANLMWASFIQANLTNANLVGAIFKDAVFSSANLKGATFLPLLCKLRKNRHILDDDNLINTLSSQLDSLKKQNSALFDGIHEVRRAIAKNIVSLVNEVNDIDKKLTILDMCVKHPIFSHRSSVKRYTNVALSFFTTYQIPTDSQAILITLQNRIRNNSPLRSENHH